MTYENVQDALIRHDRYTINGGRFLMAEIPDLTNPVAARAVLRRLIDGGITPIITHPERHELLRRDPGCIRGWIAEGCLLQVTAGSLMGRFGGAARKSGWSLVEGRLAHFIASDAHGVHDRSPRLDDAFEAVVKRVGSERAHNLFVSNPLYVLQNNPLPYGEITPPKPQRKWFQLWPA
jgi:protein-tyrosine phosphatase